jgi:imidazolonepropionase-like amidohydrolase
LLHGSANPIGGQSALIKLRWGSSAEEMKIQGAPGFIKFALGENVKQSNWGDMMRVRYPQTRMGVEQVYYDAFYRAREYAEVQKIYRAGLDSKKNKKNAPITPRKDLELEAMAEILNGQRFITCHSYVQSEINMLMHVADSMDFKVNTFTHILEGYKVADKMKAHGVGASTFSDWWAYKYEVNDAIPYNAAILSKQGITTAINSDDAEMGRRLNQEAAKAVKYGGVSQVEAWKMVTLNPAKLLHLDARMGSVKVGKDADLVLWTKNPLSINAVAEMTFVDGRRLFDRKRDAEMRLKMKEEKARLVQEMIQSGSKGKKQKIKKDEEKLYHCDTLEETYEGDF